MKSSLKFIFGPGHQCMPPETRLRVPVPTKFPILNILLILTQKVRQCSSLRIVEVCKNIFLKNSGCDIIKNSNSKFPQHIKTHFITLKYLDKMSKLASIISGGKNFKDVFHESLNLKPSCLFYIKHCM